MYACICTYNVWSSTIILLWCDKQGEPTNANSINCNYKIEMSIQIGDKQLMESHPYGKNHDYLLRQSQSGNLPETGTYNRRQVLSSLFLSLTNKMSSMNVSITAYIYNDIKHLNKYSNKLLDSWRDLVSGAVVSLGGVSG